MLENKEHPLPWGKWTTRYEKDNLTSSLQEAGDPPALSSPFI